MLPPGIAWFAILATIAILVRDTRAASWQSLTAAVAVAAIE